MKLSFTITSPVKLKRIRNGEKVIWQTEPDDIEVDVQEGEVEGKSWVQELHKIFDEYEQETRRARSKQRRRWPSSNPIVP